MKTFANWSIRYKLLSLLVLLGVRAFEPGQMDRDDLARQQQRKAHRLFGEPIPTFEWNQHDRRLQAAQVDRSLFV